VVLDRPNPISGMLELAEGPMLETEQSSFIGRWPIPIRHSCTLGELAKYFKEIYQIGVDLEVIACIGWERSQFQPDWGTPFVSTSPAIQQFEAMVLYPGLCLLEATNISEGRGTALPFLQFGAPWMDGNRVAKTLYDLSLDEVSLEPVRFTPDSGNWARMECKGVRCYLTDTPHFQPVYWGLMLLKVVKDLYPNDFSWASYPTLANPTGTKHLDKLLGVPNSEALFDLSIPAFLSKITRLTQVQEWRRSMSKFLLYN
jgi:uncharacterized protein YbbC (DUF1343 family)